MKYRIAHFSDLHLCPLNHIPQSRTESYHKDVEEELILLRDQLKQDADVVVFSGDLFHLKNQSAYSPKDMNYYHQILKDFPPFYSIPGNHDLPKSSLANLQDSPYHNLMLSLPNVIRDVSFPNIINIPLPEGKTFKRFQIVGIPYIPINTFKDTLTQLFSNFDFQDKDTFYGFLVHVDATPQAMLVNLWASFVYQELTEIFPKNSILFLGHIHQSFPPFHNPDKNVFISKPWSMGRVVKDYFNQTDILQHQHLPGYSLVELDDSEEGFRVSIQYKPLQGHKAGTDIFVMESLKTQLEKSKEIQNFIQGLKQGMGESTNPFFVADPMLYLQGLNIQKEVFEVIQEYLNK